MTGSASDPTTEDDVCAQSESSRQVWKQQHALLSAKDVADVSGFSVHTIKDWTEEGLLPAMKIGNRLRYRQEEVIVALKGLNRRRRRRRHAKSPT